MSKINTPLVGLTAYSGTGKTTLLIKLITILADKGIRVGIIKHAHHTFDIDQPGKDSYKLRKAGASEMLIGSVNRWALMVDADEGQEFTLEDHILQMDQDNLDLILVEGFKLEKIPKIELTRPSLGNDLFFPDDDNVIAIATDEPLTVATDLPVLDINNPDQIVAFICDHFLSKKH
jgi:molybdopterin-guanine dinucleotide biosynthesis protein MobB